MGKIVYSDARKLFSDFAPYPRWILRSNKLTADETAYYLWFLSHDEDYEVTKDRVLEAFPGVSERTYRRVMQGLDVKGLVTRSQKPKGPNSFARVEYIVHVPSREDVETW